MPQCILIAWKPPHSVLNSPPTHNPLPISVAMAYSSHVRIHSHRLAIFTYQHHLDFYVSSNARYISIWEGHHACPLREFYSSACSAMSCKTIGTITITLRSANERRRFGALRFNYARDGMHTNWFY